MDNFYKDIIFESSFGYAYHEIVFDEKNNPCNYIFLEANKAFEKITGLKAKDIIGRKATEVFPSLLDDNFDWIKFYADATRTESHTSYSRHSDKYDLDYWIDVFSPNKNHFVTFFSLMQLSETNFKNLFNNMPIGGVIYKVINDGLTGEDYIALDFNKKACIYEGKNKFDMVGKTSYELRPNLNEYGLLDVFRHVWKTGIPQKFGTKRYKDTQFNNFYDIDVFRLSKDTIVAIYDDVSDFIASQNELEEKKDNLQAYLDNAPYGIFIADKYGHYVEVNEEACRITGYEENELIGKTISDLIIEPQKQKAIDSFKLLKSQGIIDIEIQYLTKSGEIRWGGVRASKQNDDKYLIFVENITEKKANKAMVSRFENILNMEFMGYIFVDFDGTILHSNDYFANVHGLKADEIIGENLRIFHTEEQLPAAMETVRQIKEDQTMKYYEVMHWDSKNKREFPMLMSATVMKDENGSPQYIAALAQDITDYKILEEKNTQMQMMLQNQQKLESIGTLASGVAHEINNPINGIMNYSQLIADSTEQDSENYIFANEIIKETKRVAGIVNSLLQFSRQGKTSYSNALISDIINSSRMLIETLIKHDYIDFTVDIQDNLPQIRCRSQQIQQVLLNLITNAADSLSEKYGKETDKKKLQLRALLINKNNKEYVQIQVEDNGMGISGEIKTQIFDPFFTTKPRNKGTGLGLAISYGIISEHQGDIYFESEKNINTIFFVDIPVSADKNQLLI